MGKWREASVFIGAGLLVVCNVDWVIIPLLKPFFHSLWSLWLVVAIIANIELILWYHFWRWFFTKWLAHRRSIEQTIEFAKEIGSELKAEGYIDRVVTYFEHTFTWASNPEGRLFKIVKAWGHAGMLFLGFEPFVFGGRLVGVVFCATTGWTSGLYMLVIGNSVHVLVSVGTWEAIFVVWRYAIAIFGM